ncbi:YugN-like family protein [Aquibacillus koreensis]|uniref:YugN-like family protein n=1 Tax=Aquibacillus koreensis TaxID=279446 RepID=A0A9X4AJN7_9BACI|nr:YugN-like family protein [Aquibacillus koreensis]MCT2538087.1 YugN-like family protein [Aquibacillus koreensis]MDC3420610.1 YugN-like family protein [Aquibacillus koreensis]
MKIENTGIEGAIVDLKPLDHVMSQASFVRAGQWDYERVTYDYKIGSAEKNITYYIRLQGYALEGDVDKGDAVMKVMTPLLGKHYYPHGIEYGEQENFPQSVVDRATNLFKSVKDELDKYKK